MIHQALSILAKELNQHLAQFTRADASDTFVSLTNLTPKILEQETNVMLMTLINVQEEKLQPNLRTNIGSQNLPPLQVNLDVLISANFQDYNTGLKLLSAILDFFQNRPVFTRENNPSMNGQVTRISAEIVNQDSNTWSSLWSMLGATYQPSVVYKFKVLGVNAPPIVSPIHGISAKEKI